LWLILVLVRTLDWTRIDLGLTHPPSLLYCRYVGKPFQLQSRQTSSVESFKMSIECKTCWCAALLQLKPTKRTKLAFTGMGCALRRQGPRANGGRLVDGSARSRITRLKSGLLGANPWCLIPFIPGAARNGDSGRTAQAGRCDTSSKPAPSRFADTESSAATHQSLL